MSGSGDDLIPDPLAEMYAEALLEVDREREVRNDNVRGLSPGWMSFCPAVGSLSPGL